jgi:acetolactate synthase-1/2/3 large subunit
MTGCSSLAALLATGCRLPPGLPSRRRVGGLSISRATARRSIRSKLFWTQARENLDVTTVILSNRRYAILEHELAKVGANPGRTALDLFDLENPTLDWISLAAGMGVEAARAKTLEELADLLTASYRRKGPFLIELVIA